MAEPDEPVRPERVLHTDRARAESFGPIATAYDRYRPYYPDALIADLVALNPRRALDIGCGTGRVAVPLVACGVAVLGIEVDPQMAAVAEGHGIFVEVSSFEDWDPDGRSFQLATCGQAWHWIDPERGAAKAADVLDPGGTLAVFWNRDDLDEDVQRRIRAVYAEVAPQADDDEPLRARDNPHVAQLEASGRFASVETKRYRWEHAYTADSWVDRALTTSNHILLADDVRARLMDGIRRVIDAEGGTIDAHFTTYTIFARTAE